VKACRIARAFSLIELSVLIAIIPTLAALLTPALSEAKTEAQGVDYLGNVDRLVMKIDDLVDAGPSGIVVILDEREDSVNDGYLAYSMTLAPCGAPGTHTKA
jgi:hypothetical protein